VVTRLTVAAGLAEFYGEFALGILDLDIPAGAIPASIAISHE